MAVLEMTSAALKRKSVGSNPGAGKGFFLSRNLSQSELVRSSCGGIGALNKCELFYVFNFLMGKWSRCVNEPSVPRIQIKVFLKKMRLAI